MGVKDTVLWGSTFRAHRYPIPTWYSLKGSAKTTLSFHNEA